MAVLPSYNCLHNCPLNRGICAKGEAKIHARCMHAQECAENGGKCGTLTPTLTLWNQVGYPISHHKCTFVTKYDDVFLSGSSAEVLIL